MQEETAGHILRCCIMMSSSLQVFVKEKYMHLYSMYLSIKATVVEAESPGKNPVLNASTFCGEQKYLGLDPWLPSHCSAAHPLDLLPLVLAFGSSQRPPVASRTDVCRENTGGLLTAALQAALGLCALPSFHVTSSLSLWLQSLTRPGVSLQPISVSPKIKSVLQQFCRN